MPLPSVLSPNSAERPGVTVLIDALNVFKELKIFATLCNLLIANKRISVGLPFVRAKSAVTVGLPCSEQSIIGLVSGLVDEHLQDTLGWVVENGQLVEIIVAFGGDVVMHEFSRVAGVSGLVCAPDSVWHVTFNSIARGVCFNHSM